MERIIDAAKKTGAQAIHPGYGFLSENCEFPRRLEQEGIAFIGPGVEAIELMGDKLRSKKLAAKSGVNTIPGYMGEVETPEEVVRIAHDIGYPVMIKASAGGGGKGMRIAWNDQEALEGFRLSKDEAKASFGDDRMIIEKFVDNPRHIEIQVLCDEHGHSLYLPERECSIQRRNQKVLEEAPSSYLDEATRRAMGEQAVSLCEAVKYKSAGTVEMLVDSQKNFFFLEMNTRLQVEHPVTEYITGIDLVEEMIRVAAGHPLSVTQEDIKIKGWSMEARVYAEDPLRNFLPSIGRLQRYAEPFTENPNVRCDTGVREGSEISVFYDPLICKLVTYGKDRLESINLLKRSLDNYIITGVNHNIPFLRAVMSNSRYVSGNISTKFIGEEYPDGFVASPLSGTEKNQLLGSMGVMHFLREKNFLGTSQKLREVPFVKAKYSVELEEEVHDVWVCKKEAGYVAVVDGQEVSIEVDWPVNDILFHATIDGEVVDMQMTSAKLKEYVVQYHGSKYGCIVRNPVEQELVKYMPIIEKPDLSKMLVSPMPGTVISIAVQVGDDVVFGQELAIVEAMKMQNVLRSEVDGKVKTVCVEPGTSVGVEEILIEFE
jgi:propionyl-CoA carboxylase alpha chain